MTLKKMKIKISHETFGRPPLGDKKRTQRIAASFTKEEKRSIKEKAKEANISPSEFLYRAALRREISAPIPAVNLQAIRELNAIGQTLYRFLKRVQADERFDQTECREIIEKSFALLTEIKSKIRGEF